jgi:hypothetical protein
VETIRRKRGISIAASQIPRASATPRVLVYSRRCLVRRTAVTRSVGPRCWVAPPVARRGPHRSGRAELPHPALRVSASLRSSRTLWLSPRRSDPPRASPSSSLPVLLPTRVSFRGLVSSVSLPSFLRVAPTPPGAALCSAGSLGSVPPLPRSYCGTPTSPAPGDARFPRTAVPSSSLGDRRPPRFLGSPCLRAMALDAGGASAPRSAD